MCLYKIYNDNSNVIIYLLYLLYLLEEKTKMNASQMKKMLQQTEGSVLTEMSDETDIEELLKTLNVSNTEYLEDKTLEDINKDVLDILTEYKIKTKEKKELLSTAVTKGVIQVTHEGLPIVLMSDAQTTGGYPRIGRIAGADLSTLAQCRPSDKISFKEISEEDSINRWKDQQLMLKKITA